MGGITGEMKSDDKAAKGVRAAVTGKGVQMTCNTLSAVLERYGVRHVDFMNLDVEGVELQCLQGVNWNEVVFDVIGVEYNPAFKLVEEFLVKQGFIRTVRVWHDVMFVHKSATKTLEVLSTWRQEVCHSVNDAVMPYYKKRAVP